MTENPFEDLNEMRGERSTPLYLLKWYVKWESPILEALVKADQVEAVKEFVLSRQDDIEKDIENFGVLKPVLNHFLKEAEVEA
ncbi:hypothetical protein ES702_02504 [subsurface metagenome]